MKWVEEENLRPPECWDEAAYRALDLQEMSGGAAYHLMTAMIVPRPVALVSSLHADGGVNVAPYSFFNGICSSPPLLSVAVIRKPGDAPPEERMKDTAANIRREREFVVNICRPSMARAVQEAGTDQPPTVSEAELTGMELLPSKHLRVPRVANCPVQLECRLEQVIELGDSPTDLAIGRIVEAHALDELFDDRGRLQVDRLDPLARLSAGAFSGIEESFRFKPPA